MKSDHIVLGLWLCLGVLTFRVMAQFVVQGVDVPFLPTFDSWYSGAVSYPILLASQLLLISIMTVVAYRVSKQTQKTHVRSGQIVKFIAVVYFTAMFIRLLIGLIASSDHVWLNRPIPSFFHLILASYLFLYGQYLSSPSRRQHV